MDSQMIDEQKQMLEEDLPILHSTTSAIVVKDAGSRALALSHISTLKEVREKIETHFHPTANKVAAYKVYGLALDSEHKFYDRLDADVEHLTKSVKQFNTAEAIKAKNEVAARLAEIDRAEKARLAEIQRKIDEENAKIQAAKDEEARKQREIQDRLSAEADASKRLVLEAIEKERQQKAAADLAEQARKAAVKTEKLEEKKDYIPAPVFTPPLKEVKKLTVKARVTSIFKLCKLIAEGVIPFSVLEVSQVNLNNWAKTQNVKTQYDGIELTEETTRI